MVNSPKKRELKPGFYKARLSTTKEWTVVQVVPRLTEMVLHNGMGAPKDKFDRFLKITIPGRGAER